MIDEVLTLRDRLAAGDLADEVLERLGVLEAEAFRQGDPRSAELAAAVREARLDAGRAADVLTLAFQLGVPQPLVETGRSPHPPDEPDNRTTKRKAGSTHTNDVREADRTSPGPPPALALEPDILGSFVADFKLAGVAGEERLAQILFLALMSRMLPWGRPGERPVSVVAKGSTSTGKSHATQTTLRFFPESAFIDLGSMSRKYLVYTEESFRHRFISIPEYASIKDDPEIVAMLRILLSEGRIVHGTVEGEGRKSARRIEKAGPTGLLMTTTDASLEPELETRCLSTVTDDSAEQTRRVYEAIAGLENDENSIDFARWHELQQWIEAHGETRVLIPFTPALAALMPTSATRLRRDFVTLLSLIRAHAIVYRAQREIDASGRIIATVEGDYRPVRALVTDLISEGVDATVSDAMRATVEAVRDLQTSGATPATPSTLMTPLGIGRSATYDRISRALSGGYLVNEATPGARAMKLVIGSPLPTGEEFLPSVHAVVQFGSESAPGHATGSTIGSRDDTSGYPVRPPGRVEALPSEADNGPNERSEGATTTADDGRPATDPDAIWTDADEAEFDALLRGHA